MSNLLAIAAVATATASLPSVSAGKFSHLLLELSRADVDLVKIRCTITMQRAGGQEAVIPGVTLDVLADVADALGLGAIGGRSLSAVQTANAAPAAGSVLPTAFAIPIGARRMSGNQTLTITLSVESALTGTYTAVLYDDGASRAQGMPLQFALIDTGTCGRPAQLFAFRTSVATAAGDVAAATAASLSVTITVDGEGSHTINGAQLAALGALHDTAGIPTRCVRIYSAPDIQAAVSVSKAGTDQANWAFLAMQVPEVPVEDLRLEGAARAASIASTASALPDTRRQSLQFMGLLPPDGALTAQAEKFAGRGG